MTRLDVLHAHTGKNITRLRSINFVALIGVHFNHTADALGFSSRRVQDGVAFLNLSRINADKGESTKAIIHNFECQSSEGFFDRNYRLFTGSIAFFVGQILRIHFHGAWQIINNRIEH